MDAGVGAENVDTAFARRPRLGREVRLKPLVRTFFDWGYESFLLRRRAAGLGIVRCRAVVSQEGAKILQAVASSDLSVDFRLVEDEHPNLLGQPVPEDCNCNAEFAPQAHFFRSEAAPERRRGLRRYAGS